MYINLSPLSYPFRSLHVYYLVDYVQNTKVKKEKKINKKNDELKNELYFPNKFKKIWLFFNLERSEVSWRSYPW